MNNPRFASLGLAMSFIVAGPAVAQNYLYATGNPSFSTQIPIENGFINVNNGDIHMEIPLALRQQRGRLQLDERLVYDSRIWKIVKNGGYSWQPTNVPNSMGGWTFNSGIESGTIGYQDSPSSVYCQGPDLYLSYDVYWNFNWTDPQGTTHSFPTANTLRYGWVPPKCVAGTTGVNQKSSGGGYASDGSGYYAIISNYNQVVIQDKDGNQFNPRLSQGNPPSTTPLVTDSNGNYWSQDSNKNLIDTLGNAPVEVSSSGNQIYYDVLGFGGVRNRYTVTTESISYSTAFSQTSVAEVSGSFTAIQKIQLPDGSAYSFTYDSGTASGNYGELTSVTLPGGGVIQYTYANFLDSFQNMNRWVQTRVKDGGTTKFTPSTLSRCTGSAGCQEKTIVTDPSNNDTVYTFTLDSGTVLNASSWNTGVDAYKGLSTAGGTKVKSFNTTYTYTSNPVFINQNGQTQMPGTYLTANTVTANTVLQDVGLTAQTQTTLDSTGSVPSSVKMWDYYSGSAPSSPTTQTNTTYYGTTFYPQQITTLDGSGNQLTQTTYSYDGGTLTGVTPVHSGAPTTAPRNNPTTIAQWLNTSSSTLNTTATYDTAGVLLTSTDPNGSTAYSHDPTDTFVTTVTPPTPLSGVSLTYSATYDGSTGLLASEKDPNGATTTYFSYDWDGRPTQINYPDGGKMTASYVANQTGVERYMDATTYTNSQTQYDGYGRVSRVAIGNGQSTNPYYQTDTCYDLNGRVSFQAYRYQGTGWGTSKVCSGVGDVMTYDALSRPLSVAHYNLSAVRYNYAGRATQIVDENNATRIVQDDALGRISAVCEISSNNSMPGGSVTGPCGLDYGGTGFKTNYAYSLANHTTTVTQGSQVRSFQTDSLGRSIAVSEPERGNTTYSYKYSGQAGLGLIVTRTRGTANQGNVSNTTTTTTNLDSLGRTVNVLYSDGTPGKYFAYDQSAGWAESGLQTNMKGRLSTHIRYLGPGNASSIYGYDAMGRVTGQVSCQPSGCGTTSYDKQINYAYNTAGMLTSESDGAGDTYTYSRSPAGEITGITESISNASNPANLIVPGSVQNGPFGPLKYNLGSGLTVVNTYDPVGRQNGGFVCSGSSQPSCAGGGAQLYGWSISRPGLLVTEACDTVVGVCNAFSYDEFDRLIARTVNQGTTQNFTYTYDRYGNRWTQTPQQSGPAANTTFNEANNIISSPGFGNDVVGNVVNDSFHQYSFDADGNLTGVDSGQTAAYYYDSMNQRVRIAPTRGTYEFAFDVFGRRVSTWAASTHAFVEGNVYTDTNPLAIRTSNIQFEHQSWLGTERVRTSNTGSNVISIDSLPWADGHTPSNDNGDQHDFAGMERDLEDNTEHAQYRQYSSNVGRWLSPDPTTASYDFSNPQSFNRYSYVLNDPNGLTDPSGLSAGDGGFCSNPLLCVVAVAGAIFDFEWLFGGPSFHGTLTPRPTGGWDGNFGESLGIPTSVPHGNWGLGLGLPSYGCEFGACGGGPSALTPGQTVALGGPILPSWAFSLISLLHLPYADPADPNHRLFDTHNCGPGGGGGATGGLDQLCAAHDACYSHSGVSAIDNLNPFTSGAAMGGCDRLLCYSLQNFQSTSPQERSGKDHIQQIFGCGYILKQ